MFPAVKPPLPEQIIDLSMEEIDKLLQTQLTSGDKFARDGNVFWGYTLPVNNIQQINQAYLKLRILHPRARHIICAYILENVQDPEQMNFCDDGEIAAGRILLKLLQENNMQKRAIFALRYFGENKIGNERFSCIQSAVESALRKGPQNCYTGCEQQVTTNTGDRQRQLNSLRGMQQMKTTNRGRPNYKGRGNTVRGASPYGQTTRRGSYRDAASASNRRYNYRRGVRFPRSYGRSHYNIRSREQEYNSTSKKRCVSASDEQDQFHFSDPHSVHSNFLSQENLIQKEDWSNTASDNEGMTTSQDEQVD